MPERLREHGLSARAVLRQAGLPDSLFQEDIPYVTTAELFSLWRAIGTLSPDPEIGLKLGYEPRFERYQPTAIAAVCSRSFRDALQRIARYKRLTCPEEIRVRTSRQEASVEAAYTRAEEAEPDVLVDLVLSWIKGIGDRGTQGRIVPLRLELVRPEAHARRLEAHFGCPVRFQARRNALVFRDADLDLPFLTYNEELLAAIGAQLESELKTRGGTLDLGEQIKHSLKRSLAGKRPTLQDIARELGMSARTLQRRLTDAEVTFQQLVEATRRELARQYLSQRTIELKEAAFLLGYEDANSFFRAFQEWEGTSPGAWRARRLAA